MMTENLNDMIRFSTKGAVLTRLISEMNINVVYSNEVESAKYMDDTKTIVFPMLMCMEDDDIHQTLIFRQASHALFSSDFDSDTSNRLVSVLADIRDANLLVEKYPMIAKTFHAGYKKLLDREFFGRLNIIKLASFSVRLNVYAKVGPIVGDFIHFTSDEFALVNRCLPVRSYAQIEELSREIDDANFKSMKTIRHKINNLSNEEIADSYGEYLDCDNELNDDDVYEAAYNLGVDFIEKMLVGDSVTQYSIVCYQPASKKYADNINKLHEFAIASDSQIADTLEFRNSAKRIVANMVRVFETKKAANRMKYAKSSDTGLLNMNRVINYRFSEDIFLNQMTLADSKSHGYVVLLDCSGSITKMYRDMAEQVLLLVEFFRAIGVKYVVYGFGAETSNMYNKKPVEEECAGNSFCKDFNNYTGDMLVEFLTSEMSTIQHAKAAAIMHNRVGFGFGCTPTNSAMAMIEHIGTEFFSRNQIQVKKLVIITDGEPTDTNYNFSHNSKKVVFDPSTHKTYKHCGYAYGVVDLMGTIFKDRYDIELISIALVPRFSDTSNFVGTHSTEADKSQMRMHGFVSYDSPSGNKVFIAKSVSVDDDVDGMKVTADMSISKTASAFHAKLKKITKSKNFLNILANSLSI